MSISFYSASVPVFNQMLTSLRAILKKAESHTQAHHIEPDALLLDRLFPDMLNLTRQVQIACDFTRGVCARLSGIEVPKVADDAKSFADLDALISDTLTFIDTITPGQMDAAGTREIVLRAGTPKERKLAAPSYLLHYGLPQFFFHVTTAYAILRHNGVELGKADYMGTY